MKAYKPQDIINIAVAGRSGGGKTTLTEAIIYDSGATERQGRVEDRNTVSDSDPEEMRRQISIGLALAAVEWDGKKVNLIDAPGYSDFEGEAVAAMQLADSALIVVSARDSDEYSTEKTFAYCRSHGIPRAFCVNQIDKEHADFTKTVNVLRERCGGSVTPVMLPVLEGGKFTGIVDLVQNKCMKFDGSEGPVPDDLAAEAEELREAMIENAAGSDEDLMEKYLDSGELSAAEIERGLRLGVLDGSVAPVFVCAAAPNLGVRNVMNQLVQVMPSAAEMPARDASDRSGTTVKVERDPSGALAAQVMKSIADPFGNISLVKIFRGTLSNSMTVQNTTSDASEKTGNLGVMLGKKLIKIPQLTAGDIGALTKLSATSTGDTLAAASSPVVFAAIEFPAPSISLAVDARKRGDEEKVMKGLRELVREDPSLRITSNKETGERLLGGLGEVHLEVIMNKLKNKYGADGVLSDPRIPYRETISRSAEAEGKHKKQSGGAGQFGVVSIRFEPLMDSDEFEFVNNIVGGVVPKEYIPSVEKGLREAIQHGVLAGFPMVGLKATLFDGKYHPVDSKDVAFKSAARLAYKAACAKANPVILEPIMHVEVTVPNDYMGEILGDINKRRGRILGTDPADGMLKVSAEVPMSEMVRYTTDLRSMTQGTGSFTEEFARYEQLPANMAAKVIEQAAREADEG
ncbi:MAG: elongation factor G [Clostridia bacterium]|nr:elongation factor G [Clostridia bacterium]